MLTPRQRKYLKGLGHSLKPGVHLGKDGITDKFLDNLSNALNHHELVKVSVLETSGLDRKEAAEQLGQSTGAEVVAITGFRILLYRRNETEPKIVLPLESGVSGVEG